MTRDCTPEKKLLRKKACCEGEQKQKESVINLLLCTLWFLSPNSLLKSISTDSGNDTDLVAPSPGLTKKKHCDTPINSTLCYHFDGWWLACLSWRCEAELSETVWDLLLKTWLVVGRLNDIHCQTVSSQTTGYHAKIRYREFDKFSNPFCVAKHCHVRCNGKKAQALLIQLYFVWWAGVLPLQ